MDDSSPTVLVEYSSPNTNKPLHLGHVRNNLLGFAVANILEASGKKIVKTQIINDRGIHVCKSMVAWQDYGNGETPESVSMSDSVPLLLLKTCISPKTILRKNTR